MRNFFLTILFSPSLFLLAQQLDAVVEVSGNKGADTNYVKFYKDKLILALWQSVRSFDIMLSQKMMPDSGLSSINYIANSNQVTGLSVDFDILSFSFGFRSVPLGDDRTGNTDYLDLGLNLTTRGFRFENSFKRYTGFYDKNTPKYISSFTDSTPYFQNPSLNLQMVKSKLLYAFRNKRFALGAAYANAKRQVKSAGSVLLVGNFYALSMSSDSSMIPPPLYPYYGIVWDGFNKMNIYAFSAGAGLTRTFVFWKNCYLNILLSLGLERQYRHFYTYPENAHLNYWKTWFASDWRTALGYNGKNFFIRISNIIDITNYEANDLKFEMQFIAGSFDFGYRFNFKTPKVYKKFQETGLYKML